ncbi:hypothetical protein WICPIJ_005802 [Wickerhamomyces pijperi]|uniref:ADIPOR-like receptor IZH3 n=1 Tax=Wickerhamomyces pijperi TaxID=599730 RepID=A0A9P8TM04_WICPI|nr:hypothetical protein WICPIJ_005802 [Wickerhamomyces pijperi]
MTSRVFVKEEVFAEDCDSTDDDQKNGSQTLTKRSKNYPYNQKNLELIQEAHSSSCSINKIIESNYLQRDIMTDVNQFIQSIERKVKRVESKFPVKKEGSRDGSDSLATLQNLYETLIEIKKSVFKPQVDLDDFNRIIDSHYGHLLSSIDDSENLGFHEKLLTSLRFIDSKINEFTHIIGNEASMIMPASATNLVNEINEEVISPYDSIRAFELKFHNYEHAIQEGTKRLLHLYELPFPWRENEYIVWGYRFTNNHYHCVQSIFQVHNETINIWTHLAGCFYFFYICLFEYPRSELFQKSSISDICMIYLYLFAGIKCLISSSVWHTFNGTANLYLRKKFACIDYTGITVLITASVVVTEYTSLYHSNAFIRVGFVSFSLICGIAGFFFNWSEYFDHPKSKPFRIGFYIVLSLLGFGAYVIMGLQNGFVKASSFYAPAVGRLSWYLVGVVFYGSLFPEILRSDVKVIAKPEDEDIVSDRALKCIHEHFCVEPEKFSSSGKWWSLWWVDYIGSSHNIWHCFVLLGVTMHYFTLYEMMSIAIGDQ